MNSSPLPDKHDKFAHWFPNVDAWDKKQIEMIYHRFEGTKMRPIAKFVSKCGDPGLWGFALVISAIVGLVQQNLTICLYLTTAFLQSYLIYYLIKHFVKRPRPFRQFEKIERLDKTGYGYSFPSGHAHHSALLMGMLWLLFFDNPFFIILLLGYNFAVGYSRMVSGVHFPSDAIVGVIEAYLALIFHWFVTKNMYLVIAQNILAWINALFGMNLILFYFR
jgi:undecaprenyl-diphosphatase